MNSEEFKADNCHFRNLVEHKKRVQIYTRPCPASYVHLCATWNFESHHRTNARFSCLSLQYDYEYDEHGERVVLGKGTFGVVYAGRDLSNQVRLAIKEIPERDSR